MKLRNMNSGNTNFFPDLIWVIYLANIELRAFEFQIAHMENLDS